MRRERRASIEDIMPGVQQTSCQVWAPGDETSMAGMERKALRWQKKVSVLQSETG